MKNKKLLIILGALIGLVILIAILEKTRVINLYQKAPDPVQGPTEEQKRQESEVNSDTKERFIEGQPKEDSTTPPSNQSKSVELSAKQETNNTVTVFTKLIGYNNGSCELISANGAKTNTQTAEVLYQPEFSACAGFSVPIDALGKGTWTIQLSVTSNGTTENKTISYEVK